MDGRKGENWRFLKYESGRPNRLRVDGPEMKKVDSLLDQNLTAFGNRSRRSVNLGLGCIQDKGTIRKKVCAIKARVSIN